VRLLHAGIVAAVTCQPRGCVAPPDPARNVQAYTVTQYGQSYTVEGCDLRIYGAGRGCSEILDVYRDLTVGRACGDFTVREGR
jgi:hypothetical protein